MKERIRERATKREQRQRERERESLTRDAINIQGAI